MKSSEIVKALAALAQESRLTVFRVLVKRGPEGYTPGELSEQLGIAGPTLSFHLKELQIAKLVEARREGRCIYYRASFEQMRLLISFLTEECCSLATAVCRPAKTTARIQRIR